MSAKRENLLERVAALPEELLGEVEETVDEIVRWHEGVYRLSEDERAAVRKGMEAARRGEFVSDEELEAFYRRHRGRRSGSRGRRWTTSQASTPTSARTIQPLRRASSCGSSIARWKLQTPRTRGAKSTNLTLASWSCRASGISYSTPSKAKKFISTISVTHRGGGLGVWNERSHWPFRMFFEAGDLLGCDAAKPRDLRQAPPPDAVARQAARRSGWGGQGASAAAGVSGW
jgi:hypothetical protein